MRFVGCRVRRDFQSPFESRSEEHTSELQSRPHIVCRLLLEKKKRHQRLAQRLEPAANPLAELPMSTEARFLSKQVVLVGWGRVRRRIADGLGAEGIPFVVAESNRELVETLRARGVPAVWGDATFPDFFF